MGEEMKKFEIKDLLMQSIKSKDLFMLIDEIHSHYDYMLKWECSKKNIETAAEILGMREDLLVEILEEARSTRPSEIPETGNQLDYINISNTIEILENDEEIQKALFERLKELNNDDSSEEAKALKFHNISKLMELQVFSIAMERNTGNSMEQILADEIKKMSNTELLLLYEMVGSYLFSRNPIINQIVIDRIPNMNDSEFTIFIGNVYDAAVAQNHELRKTVLERMIRSKDIFSSFYLESFKNYDDFVEALLKKVMPTEKVNALLSINLKKAHNENICKQVLEMINSLTDEEFIRYLTYSYNDENEDFLPVVQDRIQRISDEDAKFLYWVINTKNSSTKGEIIEDLLISRDLLEETNGMISFQPSDEELELYEIRYKEYEDVYKLFAAKIPFTMEYSELELDQDDEEESKEAIYKFYNKSLKTFERFSELLDYIMLLSEARDEDLYNRILDLNNKHMVRLVDVNNTKIPEYLNFISAYFGSRILNMQDEKFLNKLYALSRKDSLFIDTAIVRMLEKNMAVPGISIKSKNDTDIGEDGTHDSRGE